LVAVLGVFVAGQTSPDSLDRVVDAPVINFFRGHHGLLLWLASPGTRLPAFMATAVVAVGCLLVRGLNGALLAVLSIVIAVGLDDYVLKPLVHRTYLGALVYPSGHTTAVITLAATLTVLLPPPGRRFLVPVAAYVVTIIVAIAVIALQWHYFTDTIAGAAVGVGTVSGVALVLDHPAIRRWISSPPNS
jgi:membrane-associated phospholipid phosphatase